MATNVTLKRVNATSGSTDDLHPTTDWSQIESKPSTFTPTSHTHTLSNITDAGTVAAVDLSNNTSHFLRGDGTFTTVSATDSTKLPLTGGTLTGNLTVEDSALLVGDVSNDNYLQIQQIGNALGFTFQHSNASAIQNLQGSTNQALVLGDVDNNNAGTLLGASVLQSGSWTKKLNLTGAGELYIGSTATDQVWHNGNFEPIVDNLDVLPTYTQSNEDYIKYNTTERAIEVQGADTTFGAVFPAMKTESGVSWKISFSIKSNTTTTSGVYFRIQEYDGALANGKTHTAANATHSEVQEATRQVTSFYENSGVTTSWSQHSFFYTPTSTTSWFSPLFLNWTGLGTNSLYIKNLRIFAIQEDSADANTLDGINSTQFLRSDQNDTMTGDLTLSNSNPVLQLNDTGTTTGDAYIDYQAGTSLKIHAGNDALTFVAGNAERARIESDGDVQFHGNQVRGKSVNGERSMLDYWGGVRFTWDSDTYGNNDHHSIRSTYGNSWGDDLTINSFHHLRVNLDANNNNTDARFEIGHNTTGTGNELFTVSEQGYIDLHDNELRNIGNANIFDTYRRDTIDSSSEDFDDYITSGTYAVNNWSESGDVVQNGPTNTAAGNAYGWGMLRVTNFQSSTGDASGYVVQEYIPHVSDTHYVRFQWNGSWTSWRAAWGSDNDGAGSGLDADKVDGQHGSHYLDYNNFTNTPTIPTNNNELTNGAGYITSADGGNADTVDGIHAASFLQKSGGTMSGAINMANNNITAVNQLEFNDPGEGIVFKQGSSGDITLKIIDDSFDSILNLSGTNATLQVNGTNVSLSGHSHSASNITSGEFNTARLGSGTATSGYVLKSDGDGTASWGAASGGSSGTLSYAQLGSVTVPYSTSTTSMTISPSNGLSSIIAIEVQVFSNASPATWTGPLTALSANSTYKAGIWGGSTQYANFYRNSTGTSITFSGAPSSNIYNATVYEIKVV